MLAIFAFHTPISLSVLATGMPKTSMSCGRTATRKSSRRAAGPNDAAAGVVPKDLSAACPKKIPSAPAAILTSEKNGIARLLSHCETTQTKAGWCLREALTHIANADPRMLAVVERFGLPAYLECCKTVTAADATTPYTPREPSTTFESLCRIVVGQSVSGYAAAAAWRKLLATTDHNLTPLSLLAVIDNDQDDDNAVESKLQKPVGITKSKARSLVDLAWHFQNKSLSEEFLTTTHDQTVVRSALLKVRGIGPWSCDMFQQFYLESSNILPLGDLGVRKGLAKHFGLRLSTTLSKKEEATVRDKLQIYEPYLSIITYYMWKVADSPDVISATSKAASVTQPKDDETVKRTKATPPTPSASSAKRKRVSRQVTP